MEPESLVKTGASQTNDMLTRQDGSEQSPLASPGRRSGSDSKLSETLCGPPPGSFETARPLGNSIAKSLGLPGEVNQVTSTRLISRSLPIVLMRSHDNLLASSEEIAEAVVVARPTGPRDFKVNSVFA